MSIPAGASIPAAAGNTAIGRVALRKMSAAMLSEPPKAGPAFQPRRIGTLMGMGAPSEPPPRRPSVPAPMPTHTLDVGPEDLEPLELEALRPSEPDALPRLDLPDPEDDGDALELTSAPLETLTFPEGHAPLLLDVTPQTLRIETVAGFTEVIIERNAAIPVEQSRVFTTSQDFQDAVRARVCQGESRKLSENQELGVVELHGLTPSVRGKTRIEVTFVMDADGTLQVRARDLQTGSQQSIRIDLVGAVRSEEIERMQQRQQALVG
jgi:molecular chaperone DnaK